jgi:uncharacterized protein YjbI with pentapeptide repeats
MRHMRLCFSFILFISFGVDAGDFNNCEQPVLGQAMNFAHMANFSHYVNPRLLVDREEFKGLTDSNGEASNFRLRGKKYGHHVACSSRRTKNWKSTKFTNFSMEAINSHSVKAHGAHWKNFYIAGTISDWDFQNATLENGWFNAHMKNCNFRNATLRNVGFYGAKLSKTHNPLKFGKAINFDGATLEDVTFKGSALKRASFRNTVFRSNIRFENANVRFVSQLAGATFVDKAGKAFVVTDDRANKLGDKFEAVPGEKNITSDQILSSMKNQGE